MAKIDFRWIWKDKLAGASRPGLFDDLEEDLQTLSGLGIRLVVSLVEEPLDLEEIAGNEELGNLEFLHFPIEDMSIPAPRDTFELCGEILRAIEDDRPVVAHCKAGIGRTGTILACCLVTRGQAPEEAIREIRRVNRNYIQTQSQERFVSHYRDFLREEGVLEGGGEAVKASAALPPLRLKTIHDGSS